MKQAKALHLKRKSIRQIALAVKQSEEIVQGWLKKSPVQKTRPNAEITRK